MTELYVDPDSLSAVAEVARRQHGHVDAVSSYISGSCSSFGAFSGVLNIFESSYRSAVDSALDGMRDSGTVADKVRTSVTTSRDDYLETDHLAYDAFKKLMGTQAGFPAYVAPGSGDSDPGAPTGKAPAAGGGGDADPFSLPGLPGYVDGPLGRLAPGPDGEDLGVADPQALAKEKLLELSRDAQARKEYWELRSQGVPADEAFRSAHQSVDDRASEHVYDRSQQRAEDAYDRAYDDAIASGRTPDEARDAGGDAAQGQHHGDSVDHQNRQDALATGSTYKGAYDQAGDLVDNVQSIKDHAEQLAETESDLSDYDDFENQPEDRDAEEWAGR